MSDFPESNPQPETLPAIISESATPVSPSLEPAWTWATPAPPRETPSIGDLGIFLLVLAGSCVLAIVAAVAAAFAWKALHPGFSLQKLSKQQMIGLGIPAQGLWYLLALVCLALVFRMVWERPFAEGLHWNGAVARRHAWKLILGGVVLSIAVQLASTRIPVPKEAPIMQLFQARWLAWMALVFGVFIAPACEEICFRGFLLPSLARVFGAVISTLVTSVLFGLMHAGQLAHAWAVVAVLFCVSIVLCEVRLRLNSVAASSLVHASYNGFIFVVMLIATHGFTHLELMK